MHDQSRSAGIFDSHAPNRRMCRLAIIGNAGGGKSTLARPLARKHDLPYIEIDRLLWQPGWRPTREEDYNAEHSRMIAEDRWLIDGLGRKDSITARLQRATAIILVDMPIWMHYWLAAERQIAWARSAPAHPPAQIEEMPPTEALFRTIWQVDQEWMPIVRDLTSQCEEAGTWVERIASVEKLTEAQVASGLEI